ncbi:MAG: uroporphyrinogen decarboxylase [Acetobacteraceae bacterium]|nr:uroporphyrinogen decarboxylase [Acetobacteraceae bacterium]
MQKSLLQALSGEAIWPPPVWLMRQAGRYLPEYRKLRAQAGDFLSLVTNPNLAAEITLQPIRRFGFDAAILFSDILLVPWALGQGLRFAEGEGPLLPPLRDETALAALNLANMGEKILPILETVKKVRAQLDDHTTLIGFAGAPFTVACYMVEGRGSRDFAVTRHLAYARPEFFSRLMTLLIQATIDFLVAQISAGVEAVMLFDSWAGVLSPTQFRTQVIAPTRIIVTELRRQFPDVKIIGFPRLAGYLLGEYAEGTAVDGLGMDTASNPTYLTGKISPHVTLQGNLDPMALLAGGNALRNETNAILAAMRDRPFIFNLGHGIVPQTPPEHVSQLLSQIRVG